MAKFPKDAPKRRVVNSMIPDNDDGTSTPLTMPNHPKIKGSTLRSVCTQAGVSRDEFLEAYQSS